MPCSTANSLNVWPGRSQKAKRRSPKNDPRRGIAARKADMALSFSSADANPLVTELGLWTAKTMVLALAAGFGLAVFRAKSTSFRLFTWTAVLYAAFAIPLLGWLLPPLPVPVPPLLQ